MSETTEGVKPLEELGDLLSKTGTKQADWAIGVRAIAHALGINSVNSQRLPDGLPIIVLQNIYPSRQKHMLVAYKPALLDYLEKQKQAEAAQNGHQQAPDPPDGITVIQNRLSLLEKTTDAQTAILKQVAHQVNLLQDDIHTLLKEWRNPA